MSKVCTREVYTIHKEIYSFELNKDTIREIQDYANSPWMVEHYGNEIKDLTEQEVIDIFNNNCDYTKPRVERLADAISSYLWDCEYEDEYVCVDDTAPWEDYIKKNE